MTTSVGQGQGEELDKLQQRVEHLEHERKHLLAVIEILQEIAGSLHFVDIVQAVARRLGETFGLDRCSIFLMERGGQTVRLVASYEDPSIRNYVVDVDRYPELKRALQTGETVFIADAADDPALKHVRGQLLSRRVKTITVVPITWRAVAIGAIFLRTFRDGPSFSESDIQFCRVVANLTAKALRNAHRFERLQERMGDEPAGRAQDRDRVAVHG
jgi:two-component system cell cycle response regulator